MNPKSDKGETIINQLRQELEALKLENRMLLSSSGASLKMDAPDDEKHTLNETIYRNMYENAPVNYQSLDENACFIDVSPCWLQTLGYTRNEVIGQSFFGFVTPHSAELLKAKFAYFKKSGTMQDLEFEMICKNGKHLFVNLNGKLELDEKGEFKQTHCVWTDITYRKKNEDIIRVKDWAIESSSIAVAIIDLQQFITYVNPAFCKLWGISFPAEVIGKPVADFWRPDESINDVFNFLKHQNIWIGEFNGKNILDKAFEVQLSASMVLDMAGNPVSMIVSYVYTDDRKQASKVLVENENSYRELFNNVADAIYIQDEEGTFLDVNEGAIKMYGYPREVLVGKNPSFVSAPGKNDLDSLSVVIQRAFDGEPQQFEFWGLRSNGEIFPKEVRIVSGTYFGKKVNIAMAQDISERKRSELALQDSERRFRELIELAVDGIMIGSHEGIILEANTFMQTLTGRSLDQLLGINIKELFSINVLKDKPLRYDLLNKGETVSVERDILRPDGKIIPIEMHTKMMPDGTYQSIYRDVTERKHAEEILKESEGRYRQLFESSPDAIILADIQTGMLTDANPAACSLLGYDLSQIKKLHQTEIHPGRMKEYVSQSFEQHVEITANHGNSPPIESFIQRSDGTEISVEVLSSTISLNGKQILQGVFRNTAERQQAREELLKAKEKAEASDKLKSAFLRNISHELRTPLNGIIGFSEMITQVDSTEEDRIEFNKMIKRSSSRLINTITGYMDISLIISGLTEIKADTFDVRQFLDEITNKTIENCYSRNLLLEIICKAPSIDIEIRTDQEVLRKIFVHLTDNALKFTKKGSVTLGYELKAKYHQFSVSDTGIGISPEFIHVIFDIFRQADLSASRSYEGSGLGLSIAKGYVKLLGGEIWVESEVNKGSTFYFTIPLGNTQVDIAEPDQKSFHPILPVVLVAEDDDSNYKYLEILLKRASFKVLRAVNGIETIDICRNHPEIDILITDMKMPDMDGLESTQIIREMSPRLPIIGLSGLISSHDEQAARDAGCNEYIIKPVSKLNLLNTINKLLYPSIY